MSLNEWTAVFASILSTLAETNGGPESSLYLALGADLNKWEVAKRILVGAGWMSVQNHWCTLTDTGRAKAKEINALV
jgi:hypothetical protein